ncbi:type VI secretion system tube protein Hcp [Enterobacter asburiae]|uniref:Hcp family type VI secretion system effector n=1 Tax=Scandinavium sp. UTDF21-P1B TaxID=3446379 RepID=UPI0034933FEC
MSGLVDYFLDIDGVKGESQDKDFKDWIQINSWQWAQENAGRWGVGSGGGAGKVKMTDFEFCMVSNKASPKLFQMCATGKPIAKAKLVCRKAGDGQQAFMEIMFKDCTVSSYRTAGNMPLGETGTAIDTVLPTEMLSLNFSQIEIEYKEQNADGTLGAAIKTGYNIKTNTSV